MGGRIFAFADNNDGIDSNAMMWINGGLVIASGSAAPEEGLDCDRSQNFFVKGGTLIGTGGAAVSTSSSSTQRSVIYNGVSAKTGELFVITDAEGNTFLKYELPHTMSKMAVFFSSPDLKAGGTYKVYTGGSLSCNTTVGQSSGPGGGPGNGGGGMGPWLVELKPPVWPIFPVILKRSYLQEPYIVLYQVYDILQ